MIENINSQDSKIIIIFFTKTVEKLWINTIILNSICRKFWDMQHFAHYLVTIYISFVFNNLQEGVENKEIAFIMNSPG
jgi:hypothetical protein